MRLSRRSQPKPARTTWTTRRKAAVSGRNTRRSSRGPPARSLATARQLSGRGPPASSFRGRAGLHWRPASPLSSVNRGAGIRLRYTCFSNASVRDYQVRSSTCSVGKLRRHGEPGIMGRHPRQLSDRVRRYPFGSRSLHRIHGPAVCKREQFTRDIPRFPTGRPRRALRRLHGAREMVVSLRARRRGASPFTSRAATLPPDLNPAATAAGHRGATGSGRRQLR